MDDCFSGHGKVCRAIGGDDPAIGVVPERFCGGEYGLGEALAIVVGNGDIERELAIEADIDIFSVAGNNQDRLVTVVQNTLDGERGSPGRAVVVGFGKDDAGFSEAIQAGDIDGAAIVGGTEQDMVVYLIAGELVDPV